MSASANIRAGRAYVEVTAETSKLKQNLNTPAGVILNPKRLSYLQAGWKFLDLQPPADPPPEGKEYVITSYTETDHDFQAHHQNEGREESYRQAEWVADVTRPVWEWLAK